MDGLEDAYEKMLQYQYYGGVRSEKVNNEMLLFQYLIYLNQSIVSIFSYLSS